MSSQISLQDFAKKYGPKQWSTGTLRKLFHYVMFQKFFSHFYYTFMVYVLRYVLLNGYAIMFL